MRKTLVAGVGMIEFAKPGQHRSYREMASAAVLRAVADAGINPLSIEQAYGSYIYGDSTCAQHALYGAFMTGIPIVNVNNNCASGSTAIFLARQAVQSGSVECALAFGFEEMQTGSLGAHWDDRESPVGGFESVLDTMEYPDAPVALRCFGAAGHYYMEKYGVTSDLFAKVAVKSRDHAARNPYAVFSDPITVEDVLGAPVVYMDYLTKLMCCPPTCGAGATILCSDDFARKNGVTNGIEIVGQAMSTDTEETWKNPITLVGSDMTRRASESVYNQAGIGPEDVDVVELHDCFTVNEIIAYESLGLCDEGASDQFVRERDNTYGGKYVVNPSGGLMSKGHPIGATGLAQCYELVNQLRQTAGSRQVPNAGIALQHNLGVGGAVVVTMYRSL